MYRDRFHFTAKAVIAIIIGVLYVAFLIWNATAKKSLDTEQTTTAEETYNNRNNSHNSGSNNGQHYTSGIYPPIDPSCVYWVPEGEVYHSTEKCTHISGKANIQHGTIDEAMAKGKKRPCSRCGGS